MKSPWLHASIVQKESVPTDFATIVGRGDKFLRASHLGVTAITRGEWIDRTQQAIAVIDSFEVPA